VAAVAELLSLAASHFMGIKSLSSILFSASVLMLAQGCATYFSHLAGRRPDGPRVYRGTCYDAHLLRTAVAPQEKDETHDDTELQVLIFAFIPFDLPLSFVADTILLPYDATCRKAQKSP
jgi:uncharacterized protein YceK